MSGLHLVVTIDFSPPSLRALEVTANLLRRTGGRATLIHVEEETATPHGAAQSAPGVTAKAGSSVEQLRALGSRLGLVPAASIVLRGRAAPAIIEWASRNSVDIIVTATRGRGAAADPLLGSTANQLARESPIPVLICRA